ncbi:MAG TPA: hypothetical protein PK530_16705, partial [Anaerolineales bacterium]|nr:hypothetical protein [Anaerolineales bacterium]
RPLERRRPRGTRSHPAPTRHRPHHLPDLHRWSSDWFDPHNQLEHTTNRYDVLRDGEIIASETHVRSPATRWYTQPQALRLYTDAGFTNLQMFHEFTHEPATPDDTLFSLLGQKGPA